MIRWLAARRVAAFLDRQSRFRLSATWWVPANQEAVVPVLEDLLGYPGWWPDIRRVTPAGGDAAVVIRGVLPYRLRLTVSPLSGWGQGIEAVLHGDLQGWSAWKVTTDGAGSSVRFDEEVALAQPALRLLAPLVRPLLVLNHGIMMRRGERGLRRALQHHELTESCPG